MHDPEPDGEEFTQLVDANIPRVDLVDKAANGTTFLIAKSAAGEAGTGLFAPEFVRDLIAKSQEGTVPDDERLTPVQAMALVHAASIRKAKEAQSITVDMELTGAPIAAELRRTTARYDSTRKVDKETPVAKADDMDPTAVLAEPDGDAPGDPNDPGSPAWEAVDAASARKWTGLLVRARNALCALAEREGIEAATGDGDDVFAAMDLQHAACCIDEAVGVLARFAVDEQAASDFAAEDLEAVGKAMAGFDTAALETLEGFAPVVKAGRTLSASNEAALRTAVDALQKVLASLPAPTPDDGQPVAKTKETTVTVQPTTRGRQHETDTIEPQGEFRRLQQPAVEPLAKAKGKPMFVVCDANGKPVGVCDPDDIMPIADMGGTGTTETSDAEPAPDAGDDAEGAVIPGTQTVAAPAPVADDEGVAKSTAQAGMAEALKEVLTPLTEGLAQFAQLEGVVKGLQERIEHLAAMPDDRKSPLFNGAGVPGAPLTDESSHLSVLRKAVDDAPAGPERDAANAQYAIARIKDMFTPR